MDVEGILGAMTLEQKCALLSGGKPFSTRAFPSLGVPSLEFSDGPHGLRHQSSGADNLGLGTSDPATCFPTAVTVAQTWDTDLAEKIGEALAEEAASMGVNVVLGPGLNIKRNPLCGRNFEYFSEDPLVSGRMAAAYVRGIQSRGLGACPKHFAANSQETRRQSSDSVVDERTLREVYLAGFEECVRSSHPMAIMSSYNMVNGTYASENRHLLRDVLRDEWGFDGAVVTDWGASNDHPAGVSAGCTIEMPAPNDCSIRELVLAVRTGRVSEADLDDRVREALALILRTDRAKAGYHGGYDADAHHRLARRAAEEGIVLLKNDAPADAWEKGAPAVDGADGAASGRVAPRTSPLLPLAPHTKVALVGDFAQAPRYQGAGSSLVSATRVESLLDVMRADDRLDLVGYEPGFERSGRANPQRAAAAVELARRAEVVLLCLGLDESREVEGLDRTNIRVSSNQISLLRAVFAANPNVVVLLSAGSCVEVPWQTHAPAILYLALGGQAGASAALEVVTGAVSPCGRLAETWPVRLEDVPSFGNFPSLQRTAEYREGPYVGYRYYQTAHVPVAYPFGYGLGYTRFEYSDLAASKDEASFVVTNVGRREGTDVAQVYVGLPGAAVFAPKVQLRGWARVSLAPGESRRVTVPLGPRAFQYFNVETNAWETEGGSYLVSVGASAADLRLQAEVEVAGSGAPNPYAGLRLPAYQSGRVADVDDAQFSALLGRAIPSPRIPIDANLTLRDLTKARSPVMWAAGKVADAYCGRQLARDSFDPNVAFAYNMPLRALPKMGLPVTKAAIDALVLEARGGWVVGAAIALARRKRWPLGACLYLAAAAEVGGLVANGALEALLERQSGEG